MTCMTFQQQKALSDWKITFTTKPLEYYKLLLYHKMETNSGNLIYRSLISTEGSCYDQALKKLSPTFPIVIHKEVNMLGNSQENHNQGEEKSVRINRAWLFSAHRETKGSQTHKLLTGKSCQGDVCNEPVDTCRKHEEIVRTWLLLSEIVWVSHKEPKQRYYRVGRLDTFCIDKLMIYVCGNSARE